MQALTLPAARGWRWLAEGFAIFRRNQLRLSLAVLGYWILMALINSVPLLGQLVATLLIPVFSVSLMNACRLLEQGTALPRQLLFSGFQQNLRSLLMLGVVYIAVSVAILAIVAAVDGGVLFRLVVLGQSPSETTLTSEAVMFCRTTRAGALRAADDGLLVRAGAGRLARPCRSVNRFFSASSRVCATGAPSSSIRRRSPSSVR